MNEGNCRCCAGALHSKHRVTVHPVLSYKSDGSPIRGLEKDVFVCGDCLGEDIGAKMGPKPPTNAQTGALAQGPAKMGPKPPTNAQTGALAQDPAKK